ncbi:MAG: hypothetical protein WAO30_04495 [Thermacetogeniaceae bacterium]|jgi:uncharacterized protein YjeT (DUF2065 family)
MADNNLFTYPEGWNEMLAALDFLPEEQREAFLMGLVQTLAGA